MPKIFQTHETSDHAWRFRPNWSRHHRLLLQISRDQGRMATASPAASWMHFKQRKTQWILVLRWIINQIYTCSRRPYPQQSRILWMINCDRLWDTLAVQSTGFRTQTWILPSQVLQIHLSFAFPASLHRVLLHRHWHRHRPWILLRWEIIA